LIKSAIIIMRPLNVLIAAAAVYLGGIISAPIYYSTNLLLAAVSAGLIAGFGNVINDIFDKKLDEKAKPSRPLAGGALSLRFAITQAAILASVGLILAILVSSLCLLIASIVAIGLLLYTPTFKGRGYAGNLLIAAISALAFFYGASSVNYMAGGFIPAAFAFLFHLIREIVKDMEDYPEDRAFNINTGAVKFGFRISTTVAIVLAVVLVVATIVPYIAGVYKFWYLIFVIFGTDIFILYAIFKLLRKPDQKTYRLVSGLMKAIMPLGLLAILVGSRGL
jgi:geranylgeranylglycerol-phosphate geranylgeranyltransferase